MTGNHTGMMDDSHAGFVMLVGGGNGQSRKRAKAIRRIFRVIMGITRRSAIWIWRQEQKWGGSKSAGRESERTDGDDMAW